MARNWANLPQELLELCSQCLCPKDLSAFRAVCRSWQSAATVEESSHLPWLMLVDINETLRRNFSCLSCQRIHKVLLSEAKAKRYLSSRGWVLTAGKDGELHMLKNPVSPHNHIIKLPNLNMFPNVEKSYLHGYEYGDFIDKFVLSDSPTTSRDYRVVVLYGRSRQLEVWKSGDKEWTTMNSLGHRYYIWDVIFFKGYFLALDDEGTILRYDLDGPTPSKAQVVFRMPPSFLPWEESDLVQPLFMAEERLVQLTTGCLLYVSRWEDYGGRTFGFLVLEINLDTQTCTEVKNLENTSLFLDYNSSFSLEADEKRRIKPNCIYFAVSEKKESPCMGIYHLEDCTTEMYSMEKPCRDYFLPIWIEPSF